MEQGEVILLPFIYFVNCI